MNYLELVKKSFGMIWKNKWLWWLGILASLTSGGSNINFNFYNFQGLPNFFKENGENTEQANLILGKVLGATTTGNQIQQICENIKNLYANNIFWIILFGFILLLILCALFVISISARGGLVFAVERIDKNKETNFSGSMSVGFKRFFSLFAADLIIGLIMLAGIIAIGIPTILLALIPTAGWIAAIIFGFIGVITLVILAVFLGFVHQFVYRYIMIEEKSVFNALTESYRLVKRSLSKVIIIWLINLASSIIFGIGTALAFVVLGLPLLLIGFGVALLGNIVLILYIILAALLLLALGLFLSGIFHSYISAFWTLSYLEIKRPS